MGSVMTRPDLVEVYVKLGLEYKLPVLFFSKLSPAAAKEYPAIAARQEWAATELKAAGLPMLDNLLQFYGGEIPAKRLETYQQAIQKLPGGVTALLIHCGIDNEELKGHHQQFGSPRSGLSHLYRYGHARSDQGLRC